jgi:hypothetical protein
MPAHSIGYALLSFAVAPYPIVVLLVMVLYPIAKRRRRKQLEVMEAAPPLELPLSV